MALGKRFSRVLNVEQVAKARIKNVFANGLPVYMSFSGGKDSLTLGHLVYSMCLSGEIDKSLLIVHFIDEEAIFPCVEKRVLDWRKKFMAIGVEFRWFCIEVKHFNCFNRLTSDETFICFDHRKEDVWVRQPPDFAIRSHPLLNPIHDNYQEFLAKLEKDGITITGVRALESVQRTKNMASGFSGRGTPSKTMIFPIYDWSDNDIWLYIQRNGIDFPEIYLYMYQIGRSRNTLRVSQFFSADTAKSLVSLNEFYPELMERIIKREPNAYLASLYWDSEMFGRSTRKRKKMEKNEEPKDYRMLTLEMFKDMEKSFPGEHERMIAGRYRKFILKNDTMMSPKIYKRIYESLLAGDPKSRTLRAIYNDVFRDYGKELFDNEQNLGKYT